MYKKYLKEKFPSLYESYLELRKNLKYRYYKSLDESQYKDELAKIYERKMDEPLDWNNLQTYNEKMQWAKLFDKDPIKPILSDKYLVREWVEELIGEEYLIPLLGVWDVFDDINFAQLPNKFVLKTNHASGTNIVVEDKDKFDKKKAKKKFDRWLKYNYGYKEGFQLHYRDIAPKILAEEYVEDSEGNLNDFKFMCFDGKVYYCWVDVDRFDDHRRNVYDLNWELQPWTQNYYPNTDHKIAKPENYDLMVQLADILCQNFHHVRVDLYNVDGKIYFGEMTFTNGSGFERIHPYEYNLMLGELWNLPKDDDN